jgi:hypothetical protein
MVSVRAKQRVSFRSRPKIDGEHEILMHLRGCIQKFQDWVITKQQQQQSQDSDTTAPSGKELYYLQFSLQAASPEIFGYTLVFPQLLRNLNAL